MRSYSTNTTFILMLTHQLDQKVFLIQLMSPQISSFTQCLPDDDRRVSSTYIQTLHS